ncbi:hypothetical protein CVV38_03800 [Candidatus Peregrinibacteria bacterium HGW-Peregrinibacteria-1]|jgi:hypothetical protein|nr:MAG: hypothetical protein CVV38_03800 [Candidatus Peregrinibacteria bacterium HGW-Peregrinibacteria-1]
MKNSLKIAAIALLLSVVPLQILFAAPSPTRPGIPFEQGVTKGLPYASFNNFTGNNNISESRNGDERNLLVGKNCKQAGCSQVSWADNLTSTPLQSGDKVRFQIYYHNNGDDPYNGDAFSSPNATNVQIGVNLNQVNQTTVQAVGSIYSPTNQYRINPDDATTVIKDSSGNIIRTATDDMMLNLASTNLQLKFIPDSHYLTTRTPNNTALQTPITTANTPISLPANYTSYVTPIISNNNSHASVRFNELPGCFRFSGFVEFDAIVTEKPPVVQPPACTQSTLKAYKGSHPTAQNLVTCLDGSLHTLESTITLNNVPTGSPVSIEWTTTDQSGYFTFNGQQRSTVTQTTIYNPAAQYRIPYTGKGTVTMKVLNANGQTLLNQQTCTKSLNSCPDIPVAPICTNLQVYNTYPTGQTALSSPLKPQTLYKLHTTTTYSPTTPPNRSANYTATEGIFFPGGNVFRPIAESLLISMKSGSNYTKNIAQSAGQTFSQNNIPDGSPVYFLTLTDATPTATALTVKANSTAVLACQKSYNLTNAPCQSLNVQKNSDSFDIIGGNFGDFTGNIRVTSVCDGTTETSNYSVSQIQASGGVRINKNPNNCSLTVQATGINSGNLCQWSHTPPPEVPPICKDLVITSPSGTWEYNETDFRINVTTEPAGHASNFTYRWEGSNVDITDTTSNRLTNTVEIVNRDRNASVTVTVQGDNTQACRATKNYTPDDEEEYQNPEISKKVYDTKNRLWTDLINIGGKYNNSDRWLNASHQYVTYLATVDTGSARSIEIKENALSNQRIQSQEDTGIFNLESLVIATEGSGGRQVIYKSGNFNTSRYNDSVIFNSYKLSSFSNYDRSTSYYKDRFNCEEDTNSICIENFDEIFDDFGDGQSIKINNTRNINHIFFVYQMENNTIITDQYCQRTNINYCGETFDNTASVTGYKSSDFESRYATDQDDAQALAMCSFILTRQSGDAFFKTPLRVGIDISQCYQVENCEGPCIVEEPEKDRDIISTGSGEDDDIVLSAPTHDICKFSNTDDNIAGYKNALESFSSAICELKVSVAQDWQESTINKSISASVERLARNNTTQGPKTLSTIDQLSTIHQNGVIVIEGNLTINGSGGKYIIESKPTIPAAQTYIIKNGDLTINSNIEYSTVSELVSFVAPHTIPSAAFIVLDGDIIVSNTVTRLDGIYMALDTQEPKDTGKIRTSPNTPTYDNTLIINGSLIGDVFQLFSNRRAIGDPLRDQGAITIRYDQRLLLNTPPGLNTLLDITQLRVAR